MDPMHSAFCSQQFVTNFNRARDMIHFPTGSSAGLLIYEVMERALLQTRKHSSRMLIDRAVTNSHEADFGPE